MAGLMQILKFILDVVFFFFLQKHRGVADPLEVVAGEISDEAILLCLDEFMVNYY
jgi:predicted ATPase